jgi:DNA-binding transcriptional LysR family regulator
LATPYRQIPFFIKIDTISAYIQKLPENLVDLRDMRHFLAVAEEGHIGRAAARLHLSQPPLTRHIQALEEKIGVPLFVRTPKGVTLTEAGRTLLEEVPNLLALTQQATERTRLAGQGLIGRLDVGLFGSGVLDVIPRMLARFHQARPEVKIVLHNLTKDRQLQALREPLVVAIAAAHPLAVRPSLRIPDLDGVPLILYPNVPLRGLAQEVTDAFRAEGVGLRVEQEVEDVVTAVALVSAGFGAAITTQSAANLRLPGVIFRPLHSAWLQDLELSGLYRGGDASPALHAFLDVVRAFARDPRPRSI